MTEKKFIRISIDEKNYFIKYKGYSETDAIKEAEKLISRFYENIKHKKIKNIKSLEIKAKIR